MSGILAGFQLLQHSLTSQAKIFFLSPTGSLFSAHGGTALGGLFVRFFLLCFNRFAFPTARHPAIIIGALSVRPCRTSRSLNPARTVETNLFGIRKQEKKDVYFRLSVVIMIRSVRLRTPFEGEAAKGFFFGVPLRRARYEVCMAAPFLAASCGRSFFPSGFLLWS